jgi:prophage maintenance system killer protein
MDNEPSGVKVSSSSEVSSSWGAREFIEKAKTRTKQIIQEAKEHLEKNKNKSLISLLTSTLVSEQAILENELREGKSSTENESKSRIEEYEKELGIDTPKKRILEASLFVDLPLLKVSTLRGDVHPEQLFGADAWANWLEARVTARAMKDLNSENVMLLQSILTKGILPVELRGLVRPMGVAGGDYTNLGEPMVLDDSSLKEIKDNPYLYFKLVGEEKNKGYIIYPSFHNEKVSQKCLNLLPEDKRAKVTNTQELVMALLEQTCDWVKNTGIAESDKDIYTVAATLQKRIVAIHPGMDGNGRLSRLLMNDYLEKKGLSPSTLEHPEKDLFFSDEEWAEQVDIGIKNYDTLAEKDIRTIKDMFLSPVSMTIYNRLFKNQMPFPSSEGPIRHDIYRAFLDTLTSKIEQIKDELTFKETFRLKDEAESVILGGFIPDEYIDIWGNTMYGDHIREHFYSKAVVVRGGLIDTKDIDRDPHTALKLFTRATAFSLSYRSCFARGLSPMSLSEAPLFTVRQDMRYYNELLARDYRVRNNEMTPGEDTESLYKTDNDILSKLDNSYLHKSTLVRSRDEGNYLTELLTAHRAGQRNPRVWLSPAVSTSSNKEMGIEWSDGVSSSHYGVIVNALLPKESAVSSNLGKKQNQITNTIWNQVEIAREEEYLIMGGLDPNSVINLRIERTDGSVIRAKRLDSGQIMFSDSRESFVETYVFNEDGILILKGKTERNQDTDLDIFILGNQTWTADHSRYQNYSS